MCNKISVIIPVYNVSKYIEECLESIIHQTYTNLEIILIDDGSKDNSGLICDKYANIDSRIKVIHQQNGGAGAAKNTGLKVATGEYLAFVDSDDYLETNAYENMVHIMESEEADIVHCAFKNIYITKQEEVLFLNKKKNYTSEEYLEFFLKDWTCGLLWNKLYKRTLFNGVYFKENRIIDDEFFTYQGVMNAKKIVYKPIFIYNYRQRKSSVMLTDVNKDRIVNDRIDFLTERKTNVLNKYPNLKFKYIYHMYEYFSILLDDYNCSIETRKKMRSILMKNICFDKNIHVFILFLRLIYKTHKNNFQVVNNDVDKDIYFE